MSFHFQSPGIPGDKTLLECLLEALSRARRGWGAFAYASTQGVRLLFHDEVFNRFVRNGSFQLVVGTDSITNVRALEALMALREAHNQIECKAFYQNPVRRLFHPKFCCFVREDARGRFIGGTRITGSGNLTGGGLTTNWEAFSVTDLTAAEIRTELDEWVAWNAGHAAYLKDLTDPEVRARAAANVTVRRPAAIPAAAQAGGDEMAADEGHFVEDVVVNQPAAADAVLVAEIPNSGTRWKQANFDIVNFRQFFGFRDGHIRRVVLQHVAPNGVVGDVEVRPLIVVASRNYRVELEAASGLEYPAVGKPIGVFVKTDDRTFRYCLLMPDSPGHDQVAGFLEANWHGRRDHMARVRTEAARLRESWPQAPVELLP